MILNNYWELRRLQQTNYLRHSSMDVVLSSSLKNTSGETITFMTGDWGDSSHTEGAAKNWDLISNTSLKIGASNAEGSVSDYNLIDPISSGFTASTPQWSITSSEGKVQRVISFSVTASTNITIKEVGICKEICTRLSGSLQYATVMLARAVLENPITLSAGQGAVIVIEWIEA